jgi:predicted O-methyltransferase YrrM
MNIEPIDDDGGTSLSERKTLFQLAEKTSMADIVEIGSWKGGATVYLAKGLKNKNRRVYAVDPQEDDPHNPICSRDNFTYFMENIRGNNCSKFVIPIRHKSCDAVKCFNRKIGLLFIDGLHDYQNVYQDYMTWEPKIIENGIIAFHDIWSVGPARVICQVLGSGNYADVGVNGGLFWAIKRRPTMVQQLKYFLGTRLMLAVAISHYLLFKIPFIAFIEKKINVRRLLVGSITLFTQCRKHNS